MINMVVWLICARPMARCIAMWHDFFPQPEVNLRFKDGHVVSDMAERKSVMLRRIVVMDMLPRLVQGPAG